MRSALLCLSLLLLVPAAIAADITFVRVWPAWRTEESFRRISEYFDGKEKNGGQIVLRTHAGSRAGYYFLTRVNNPGPALSGAQFVLAIIAPDSAETKQFAFPATVPTGESVFQLGLTQSDWPGPKVHPVAWKLELTTADGQVLAVQKSFLWEKSAQ